MNKGCNEYGSVGIFKNPISILFRYVLRSGIGWSNGVIYF